MTLTIPFEELNSKYKKPYLAGEIIQIGIDYQYNGLYGWYIDREVEVFNFKKAFIADNRFGSYNIFCTDKNITIEFVV
jgi:hypothetical protein|tara:strand:+ start:2693 stop:2926 length:234 start_codon:yes stop_codon:yes gene_type:complete